ncbi:MAG: hypothetical protein LBS19_03200 [Clostridiales bacterium]|jgi:hypothetical protein|nr:hypothetical protein [Clostridiales bacterium]
MGDAENKRALSNEIWLDFFNQTLYEKGIISEVMRNKMRLKIEESAVKGVKRRSSQE